MSETQEHSMDEATKKKFLRSQNTWKIGEKFPISYAPTVEGMVVSTRWIENVLMVVFLSPPYTKAEGTVAEASIMYKTAASMVRKALAVYEFPFPSDPRIPEEVRKANGNIEMLHEIVKHLNKTSSSASIVSNEQKLAPKVVTSWDSENDDSAIIEREELDPLPLHHLLPRAEEQEIPDKVLDKLAEKVFHRLSVNNIQEHSKKKKQSKKVTKSKAKKSSSSSSSSSSAKESDSDSSSSEEENVGTEKEEATGWFSCPFSLQDVRRTADPKDKMKGKVEERRYLRKALHDIYSEYQTLKLFVETVRSESLSSANKPYNSDLIWLAYHATYLDILLLHATDGPWKTWNELVVDHLAKSFLELLVRSSVNRAYPEILDERVRKWMKRKRVGLSAHFGAIPAFLAEAKVTDSGIHPKGGWESRNKSSAAASSFFRPKATSGQNAGGEKKT